MFSPKALNREAGLAHPQPPPPFHFFSKLCTLPEKSIVRPWSQIFDALKNEFCIIKIQQKFKILKVYTIRLQRYRNWKNLSFEKMFSSFILFYFILFIYQFISENKKSDDFPSTFYPIFQVHFILFSSQKIKQNVIVMFKSN